MIRDDDFDGRRTIVFTPTASAGLRMIAFLTEILEEENRHQANLMRIVQQARQSAIDMMAQEERRAAKKAR